MWGSRVLTSLTHYFSVILRCQLQPTLPLRTTYASTAYASSFRSRGRPGGLPGQIAGGYFKLPAEACLMPSDWLPELGDRAVPTQRSTYSALADIHSSGTVQRGTLRLVQ